MSALSSPAPPADLVARIRDRLAAVQARIAAAAERAGRAPEEVTLIAVTKTFPLETVAAALKAGLHDFGENRVQELEVKAADLPGHYLDPEASLRWHFVGSLQRNKAKTVVATADAFHALDSPRLARELEKRARHAERVLPCFVQVNVSGEDTKSGLRPADTVAFVESLEAHPHLKLMGLMTLAAPVDTPEELETVVRPQFRRLRALAEAAGLPALSMGMSGDFEVAIEEGATHVRLGSALFGPRD